MRRLMAFAVLLLASVAQADDAARVEAAFRTWVSDVGADQAVLTLWHGEEHVHDVAIGVAPDAPMALGSLGKATTGLCAATLVQRGRWTRETTAQEVLGYPGASATVAQLLTHSAGLLPDQTQGLGLLGRLGNINALEFVAQRALQRNAQEGTPGTYAYSNENYMILGAMIAAETGKSYQAYCTDAVLRPAGVTTATPVPQIAGLLSAGGWQMSVQDYARLMHWGYGKDGLVGEKLSDWPRIEAGGGAFYGVGMVYRPFGQSYNFWHFGQLCFPGRVQAGSYVVQWRQEAHIVVAYDRCLDWDQMIALDTILSRAVFP
jgi:CubicO group peptidase (beta-lactamase class C family)